MLDFNQTWNFLTDFRKKPKIWILIKICPVGAELFRAGRQTDGRTDVTKLMVGFRNFANDPNK